MESKQFETLMLAITGLRNELKSEFSGQFSGLRNEMKSEFSGQFSGLRNEMKSEFSGQISGLRNEMKSEFSGQISGFRNEMKSEFGRVETKMDSGFAEIRKDLKAIREQVAQTHVEVTSVKTRVASLEGPRA